MSDFWLALVPWFLVRLHVITVFLLEHNHALTGQQVRVPHNMEEKNRCHITIHNYTWKQAKRYEPACTWRSSINHLVPFMLVICWRD